MLGSLKEGKAPSSDTDRSSGWSDPHCYQSRCQLNWDDQWWPSIQSRGDQPGGRKEKKKEKSWHGICHSLYLSSKLNLKHFSSGCIWPNVSAIIGQVVRGWEEMPTCQCAGMGAHNLSTQWKPKRERDRERDRERERERELQQFMRHLFIINEVPPSVIWPWFWDGLKKKEIHFSSQLILSEVRINISHFLALAHSPHLHLFFWLKLLSTMTYNSGHVQC